MGQWAEDVFAKLTLEEKVGQVICYRAGNWAEDTIEMARKGLVGCVSPIYYKNMADMDNAIAFMWSVMLWSSSKPSTLHLSFQ